VEIYSSSIQIFMFGVENMYVIIAGYYTSIVDSPQN